MASTFSRVPAGLVGKFLQLHCFSLCDIQKEWRFMLINVTPLTYDGVSQDDCSIVAKELSFSLPLPPSLSPSPPVQKEKEERTS